MNIDKKEKRRIRKEKLKRIFTYANALSFSRILMTIPLVMALDGSWFSPENRNYICFGIMLAIFLSDVLDGPLARWTDQVSNLGKVIDPVADKICMMVVLIFLIQDDNFGHLFFIFFLLITIRDTLLVVIGIYLLQHQEEVFESSISGKIFIFISVCMMVVHVFPSSDFIRSTMYYLSILFFIISSYYYFRNYSQSFKRIRRARII